MPKTTDQKKTKPNLRYQRDKDREKVKGVFHLLEAPGGTFSFSLKLYKDDPVETYHLVDGKIYTLPLGVAKHLNKNVWYPVHSHTVKEDGLPSMDVGKKVHRCNFQSLEFMDIEDLAAMDAPVIEECVVMQKSIQ